MPEPVLVAIAAALAGKAVTSLYDLVRGKLRDRGTLEVLEAAHAAEPDSESVTALANELADAERADPAFSTDLRSAWTTAQADNGAVINTIDGIVHGKTLQARDIHGDVQL